LSVSTFLFLVILFINVVFWLSWIKLTFNRTYNRVKGWFMKRLCSKRYKSQKDFSEMAKIEGGQQE
jgi:hypothetical protein